MLEDMLALDGGSYEYDVQIRINELDPDNFNSAESIWNLVQELKSKKA